MWKRLQVAKVALLSNGHVGAKHQMKDGEYGYAATRANMTNTGNHRHLQTGYATRTNFKAKTFIGGNAFSIYRLFLYQQRKNPTLAYPYITLKLKFNESNKITSNRTNSYPVRL